MQELTNHRGVTKTVRYLLDEDTMVSRKPLRRASMTCHVLYSYLRYLVA